MSDKYNAVSMIVMHLSENTVLKLRVNFYKRNLKINKMVPFYNEVEYFNTSHHENVININLDYSYGLVLESNYKTPDGKANVWIDWFGIYELTSVLDEVIGWFTKPKDTIFTDNSGYMEVTPYGSTLVKATVINDQPLIFTPTLMIGKNDIPIAAVALTYTTEQVNTTIAIKNIMAWYTYISRVDILASAQALINYADPPKPHDTRIVFGGYSNPSQEAKDFIDYKNQGRTGRFFENNNKDDNDKDLF